MPRKKTHRKRAGGIRYRPRKKKHQTGKTHLKQDRLYIAKKPGKKRSRSNKKYYEYRRNRTDMGRRI